METADLDTPRRPDSRTTSTLTRVLDGAHEAFVAIGADGRVRMWNRAAEKTFGFSATEAIGAELNELIIPVRDREAHRRGLARFLADGHGPILDRRVEVDALHRDGHEVPVEMTIAPATVDGDVVFHAFVHDISDRRAADASARRLAEVVEGSDDAILATSLDGTVLSFNGGAERLYGVAAQDVIGTSFALLRPEGTLESIQQVFAAISRGERVPPYETQHRRSDGQLVDVSIRVSQLAGADGQVRGLSAIVRDISATKRTERHLAEVSQRFEHAFRGAAIGMALVDLDGRWLMINDAFCSILARGRDELVGSPVAAVTHPDFIAHDRAEHERLLAGETEAFRADTRYVRPDGSAVWAQLDVTIVRDDDGHPRYTIGQVQDITARKEAEEELARYTEYLTELALKDPLTGLRNLRDIHSLLGTEIERARRHGGAFSVVLLDVDDFRAVNERGGPLAGDAVLRDVADAIQGVARASDIAGRIGADDFAILAPETAGADAVRTAERIAAAVTERTGGVSLSWGVASWPEDGDSKELLLVRADMQLQSAKTARIRAQVSLGPQLGAEGEAMKREIERILAIAREQLGMDVAFVAEHANGEQIFRAVSGDVESFGVEPGGRMALEASYCRRMIAGLIPAAVSDSSREPELADLEVTRAAGIRSYVGVPLAIAGRPYGTLCCVSHDARPELGERHVQTLGLLASLIADAADRRVREAADRRAHIELAGIDALLSALVARDHYTGEHSRTVVELAVGVARELGLDDERVRAVEQVALLHDIGKVGIPDSVLQKRGPLDEAEWVLMREHPAIGARILAETETLRHLAPGVRAEHERFDGTGYPDALRGEAIPLVSRITFACDAYHAMTSDRPYRAALSVATARGELRSGAGTQFDPRVVEALLQLVGHPTQPPRTGPILEVATTVLGGVRASTPAWEPRGGTANPSALGEVRAVCRRCGAHAHALVMRATVSGSCPNCGSYELDLV